MSNANAKGSLVVVVLYLRVFKLFPKAERHTVGKSGFKQRILAKGRE